MDHILTQASYYDILQVTPQASDYDIKNAYRRLALLCHPDRNPRERAAYEMRFRLINEAYAHLNTREKRTRYNRVLRRQGTQLSTSRNAGNDNNNNDQKETWRSLISGLFRFSKGQSPQSGQ